MKCFVLLFRFSQIYVVLGAKDNALERSHVCDLTAPSRTLPVWCIPKDYDNEMEPFKLEADKQNQTIPYNYHFTFTVKEVTKITDNEGTIEMYMAFAIDWQEPRIWINENASEWTDDRFGPNDHVIASTKHLKHFWVPELEVLRLESFNHHKILSQEEMSGIFIGKDKTISYEVNVKVTVSCHLHFHDYPFDQHSCLFQVGSYYGTQEMISCTSDVIYHPTSQRFLRHTVDIAELPEENRTLTFTSGTYAICGFRVSLTRLVKQFILQNHLPTFMMVVVSWVSFMVNPEVVPARLGLLVTVLLCLTNLFDGVKQRAPEATKLNAIDLYVVVSFCFVFAALLEYAIILVWLKKLKKPTLLSYLNGKTEKARRDDLGQAQMQALPKTTNEMAVWNLDTSDNVDQLPFSSDKMTPLVTRSYFPPNNTKQTNNSPATTPPAIAKEIEEALKLRELCNLLDNITLWASVFLFVIFHIVYVAYYAYY